MDFWYMGKRYKQDFLFILQNSQISVAIKDGSATIWNYAENLINESVEKGILKKE